MRKAAGLIGLLLFMGVGAVGALRLWNLAGSTYDAMTFPAHIASGVTPRLAASDAYRITLDYLDRAMAEAQPGTTVAPAVEAIWAVTADQAAALDGCIPVGKGSGIVWVTKGTGTYLNLWNHAWSSTAPNLGDPQGACTGPGPAGTIVIDDTTGEILGVYPYAGPAYPHPSPQLTLAPASSSPLPPVFASPAASSPGASPLAGSPSPNASGSGG